MIFVGFTKHLGTFGSRSQIAEGYKSCCLQSTSLKRRPRMNEAIRSLLPAVDSGNNVASS